MSNRTNLIFKGLHIVAWIIFIGLCIEAGGLIINFTFGFINPDMVQNMYPALDLRELGEQSKLGYFGMYSFVLAIALLKAHLFYIVLSLMQKIDLSNPFNRYLSEQITRISYFTFSIGILSYIAQKSARNLQHRGFVVDQLNQFWTDSQAFILMAAVIYVIATIFKKGVDIQNEQDLTI